MIFVMYLILTKVIYKFDRSLKVDSNLNMVWSKPYPIPGIVEMSCVQSRDDGFILLGANGIASGDSKCATERVHEVDRGEQGVHYPTWESRQAAPPRRAE